MTKSLPIAAEPSILDILEDVRLLLSFALGIALFFFEWWLELRLPTSVAQVRPAIMRATGN